LVLRVPQVLLLLMVWALSFKALLVQDESFLEHSVSLDFNLEEVMPFDFMMLTLIRSHL